MRSQATACSGWWKAMREFRRFCCASSCAAGGEFTSSAPVRSITWRPGGLRSRPIACSMPHAAIITLPLGVLQARDGQLSAPAGGDSRPRLIGSSWEQAARVVYEFDHRLWPEDLSFLFAPDAIPPTWWTTQPQPSSTLTGWVAGRKASQLDVAALPETGLPRCARILGSSTGRSEEAPARVATARLAADHP